MTQLDFASAAYREAYSRINGVVIVGEGLANRHFQMLARRSPADRDELQRLGRMEGDHASAFVGCGRNLGVVAYRHYLPVADAYARPITAAVMNDESEHLDYAETWLQRHFDQVKARVSAVVVEALPLTLAMLQSLAADMRQIGMDPVETLASFSELFREALESVGFEAVEARRLLMRAAARIA